MSDATDITSLVLGSGGILGLVGYILYQVRSGSCASHLKVGDRELSFDLKDVKEVLEQVDTPEEREKIKEEIRNEMKNTLHKVKSRLTNKLEDTRKRRDAVSEEV